MESEIVDKWELLNFIWEVSYMKRVQSKKKKEEKDAEIFHNTNHKNTKSSTQESVRPLQ